MTRPGLSAPLVGRQRELEQIEHALAAAGSGPARICTVMGEAGIGKTRLANELVRRARRRRHRTGTGRCLHVTEGALPYGAWREALAGLAGNRAAASLFEPRADAASEREQRMQLFGSVADCIGRHASADRPALIVIEDVHWSDGSTRELIASLAQGQRVPALLVLTIRREDAAAPSELAGFLADLEMRDTAQRVQLGPLSAEEVARQAAGLLGRQPDEALLERIQLRAEGNPFYVEELVTAAAAGDHADLPPTLADAILVRVAELPREAQQVLRLCAVGGPRVAHRLLRAVAGMDDADLEASLRLAIRRRLLRGDVERGEDAYVFRHALVHEALYEDMLPPERTRMHARYADTLADDPSLVNDPVLAAAELARHQEAAHQLQAARQAWAAAARAAMKAVAFPDADRLFGRALAISPRTSGASSEEAALWEDAAQAARLSAGAARAAELIRQAIVLTPISDRDGRAHRYVQLSTYLWDAGHSRPAFQASEEAARLAADLPAGEGKVHALISYAGVQLVRGLHEECRRAAQAGHDVAAEIGSASMEAWALAFLGPAKVCLGEMEAGVADARRAWELARSMGDKELPTFCAMHYLTCVFLAQGAFAAEPLGRELIAEGETLTLPPLVSEVTGQTARILIELGRLDDAEQLLESISPADAAQSIDAAAIADQAILAATQGRFDRAREFLARSAELTPETDEMHVLLPLTRAEAHVALAEDEPSMAVEAAERGLRAALPGARDLEFGWPLLLLGLRAAADVAEAGRARRSTTAASAVAAAESAAQRYADRLLEEVFADSPNPDHAAWRSLALAELGRARGEDDPAAWAEAAGHARAGQLALYLAYALMRQAVALAADPLKRVEAAMAMREAHQLAADRGALALARQTEKLARRARLRLRPDEAAQRHPAGREVDWLSAREREVLSLIVAGRSNRQIAQSLYITEKTAGAHVSSILAKLGVASRGEASAVAIKRGLVEL